MADLILLPSGGPQIRYTTPSGTVQVDLPLPDFNQHMDVVEENVTYVKTRMDGSRRAPLGARNRKRIRFGYRGGHLTLVQAESLITALRERLITFYPRTVAAGDDPSASGEVFAGTFRVASPIPTTAHVTLGYNVLVDLVEAGPLVTGVSLSVVDPSLFAPFDPSVGVIGVGLPGLDPSDPSASASCTPVAHTNSKLLLTFDGSPAISDGATLEDKSGAGNNGILQVIGAGTDFVWTARGLDQTGSSDADGQDLVEIPAAVWNTSGILTCICILDVGVNPVTGTAPEPSSYATMAPLVFSWEDTSKIEFQIRELRTPKVAGDLRLNCTDWNGGFPQSSIAYLLNTDGARYPDRAMCIGFCVDLANDKAKLFQIHQLTGFVVAEDLTFGTVDGTGSVSAAPDGNTTGAGSTNATSFPGFSARSPYAVAAGYATGEIMYLHVLHQYCTDNEIITLYQQAREYLLCHRADISLESELPLVTHAGGGSEGGGAILVDNTFSDGDTTPSVLGAEIWYTANTGATSITDFDDAVSNQRIYIYAGDAVTTIVHNASVIVNTSGANDLLASGEVRSYISIAGVWYQTS